MDKMSLSSMEIDAIGEILNISLGASATAVSSMLDARVDITTPIVQIKSKEEFEFNHLEPAVGVEIVYIEGITGSNIMLLRRKDVRIIVEMLMGTEISEEDFELDDMNISAICEVMNQMMGASATALSELLSKTVNISTPESFEVESLDQFKDKYFKDDSKMVVIGFTFCIAGRMESEFINLMPIELARELVSIFFEDGVPDKRKPLEEAIQESVEEPAKEPELGQEPIPAQEDLSAENKLDMEDVAVDDQVPGSETPPTLFDQTPSFTQQPGGDGQLLASMAGMMELMRKQLETQQKQIQKIQKSKPKELGVNPAPRPNLVADTQEPITLEEQEANMELIKGVPLDVSVEIGRTKKLVKDILDLNKGSLVVLDKLAGEQVDLFVNGYCIAKGDVVVVNDNFGIRITEILTDDIALVE